MAGTTLLLVFLYVLTSRDTTSDRETITRSSNMEMTSNGGPKHDQEQTRRPWLVWHAGPPKTGTSTIQPMLEKFHRNPDLLAADGYTYDRWDDRESHLVTLLKTPALNPPKSSSSSISSSSSSSSFAQYKGILFHGIVA